MRANASVLFAIATLASCVFSAHGVAQSHSNKAESVTVIIPEDYPAFSPAGAAAAAAHGRVAIEVRGFVFISSPWSLENPAILLNPLHANSAILWASLQALKNIRNSGKSKDLILTAKTNYPEAPPQTAALLNALLMDLWKQPAVSLRKVGSMGRQVIIDDTSIYR